MLKYIRNFVPAISDGVDAFINRLNGGHNIPINPATRERIKELSDLVDASSPNQVVNSAFQLYGDIATKLRGHDDRVTVLFGNGNMISATDYFKHLKRHYGPSVPMSSGAFAYTSPQPFTKSMIAKDIYKAALNGGLFLISASLSNLFGYTTYAIVEQKFFKSFMDTLYKQSDDSMAYMFIGMFGFLTIATGVISLIFGYNSAKHLKNSFYDIKNYFSSR